MSALHLPAPSPHPAPQTRTSAEVPERGPPRPCPARKPTGGFPGSLPPPRLQAAPQPPAAYPGSPAAARPGRAPASRSAPLSRRLRAAIAAAAAIFPGAADVAHEGAGSTGSALPFLKMVPAWLRARPPAPPRCQHQPWWP